MPDATETTETQPIEGGEVKRTTKESKEGDGPTKETSVTETVEKTVTEKKG